MKDKMSLRKYWTVISGSAGVSVIVCCLIGMFTTSIIGLWISLLVIVAAFLFYLKMRNKEDVDAEDEMSQEHHGIAISRAVKLVFDLLIVLCAFPHGEHFEIPFIESNWRYIIFIIFSIGFLYYAIIFSKLEKVVD